MGGGREVRIGLNFRVGVNRLTGNAWEESREVGGGGGGGEWVVEGKDS